ncbi:kelch repeat-containing protein [Corallococcus exiguus]|uniref:kelch repeat-containing protein n=1 Tax=Corallococcus exiguus TaxID=83462 RepID=UPI0020163BFE|nr:kelch repeat-containing protein [Corallococcus exiguus]
MRQCCTPPSITVTVTNAFGLTAPRSFTVAGLPGCSVPGTWALTGPRVSFSLRLYTTATRLQDGKVLLAGGMDEFFTLRTAELYDPATGTWTPTAPTIVPRFALNTATLLFDGRVLVVSGSFDSNAAELYTP